MKIQVRGGVFETNSSSQHSLVILNDLYSNRYGNFKEDMYIPEDRWVILSGYMLEFGRTPFKCLCTFESKCRFAIACLAGTQDSVEEQVNKFHEIQDIVKKYVPEIESIELPLQYFYLGNTEESVNYGSVEYDFLTPVLAEKQLTLEEFLINPNYVIICDGDEYCVYEQLENSGIIDVDNIKEKISL